MIPMGKLGQVTDLQGAVVFMASEVSDMMTGTDLVIDGGYCCW
jgi:NAD(P)-dependent dehydrogenase (short-subunit alcohol dehydrogenase family)